MPTLHLFRDFWLVDTDDRYEYRAAGLLPGTVHADCAVCGDPELTADTGQLVGPVLVCHLCAPDERDALEGSRHD